MGSESVYLFLGFTIVQGQISLDNICRRHLLSPIIGASSDKPESSEREKPLLQWNYTTTLNFSDGVLGHIGGTAG